MHDAMQWLSYSIGYKLPESISKLRSEGVSPQALREETARGITAGVEKLVAGMELVDLPGVTNLSPDQIRNNLRAYLRGGAAGIALSWDLQLMPLAWLELVAHELEKINDS